MALRNDSVTPNAYELRVRFACGFVAGALGGVVGALQLETPSLGLVLLGALVQGLAAGLLARHYGDRFWASWRGWLD
ncbi:hypothetical protein FGE12_29210 [Aggregicoccus sp. 17bor-14]|uniref:hypothetical protein n=1 Tax=Myxococcaceae TaxID=31 RepID=UPI00129C160A|nr:MULTISPECIES: hypothetical protein [Myxococcaceae]MBF5046531.1 hypothetical protein [Simulacricoccus sp. 17bor-14]MRI92244.1 hypothetical protein [Aggregicoccus sp. 17bor-14]